MQISVVGTGAMGRAVAEGLFERRQFRHSPNRTRSRAEPLAKLGATVVDTAAQQSPLPT